MNKEKRVTTEAGRATQVRLAFPSGRPIQVRYKCLLSGKEVRVSTGTRDITQANLEKAKIIQELRAGLDPLRTNDKDCGPGMPWEVFREKYTSLHLAGMRRSTALHAESRLDLAERIVRPKTLGDMAHPHILTILRGQLAAGVESKRRTARSPHTVRGYLKSIVAALNWAYEEGWLPERPRIRRMPISKHKAMKGKPISAEEFQEMLRVIPEEVGEEVAGQWIYLLRGLWESGLRLGELLSVSWDIPGTIRPLWNADGVGILEIPAELQKSNVAESIPLVPWFEELLLETPEGDRKGWVFRPVSRRRNRKALAEGARPTKEWVGKVISGIGKRAKVMVEAANPVTGCPIKFASAHDLRRSFGQRLRDAGVPPLVICGIMRHKSWDTTQRHYAPLNVGSDARLLKNLLGKER